MYTNNMFSTQRYFAYLKKLWVERWRTNIMRIIILFAILLMIGLWSSIMLYPSSGNYYGDVKNDADPVHLPLFLTYSWLFLVSGCLMATEMLKGARRKAERISALTFPVTPLENWLARFTLSVPAFIVCFVVCMYAADTIRVLIFGAAFKHIPISYMPIVIDKLKPDGNMLLWLIYFYNNALYLLGGMFFPKKPILKTTIFLFGLFWVWLFIQFGFVTYNSINEEVFSSWLCTGFFWLSVPFLWWLSYVRFKEMQVVG